MTLRYKTVVLCRGLSENNDTQEAYVKTLQGAGYVCNILRTLRFDFVNVSELRARLLSPHTYLGLILTSRRAVEAVSLASKEEHDILRPWKTLPVYCVGLATESFARSQLGSDNCLGSQAGNAKELAESIAASNVKDSKPLLYPCSEIARETIEQTLNENGINVEKLVAYRTLPSETLEKDLLELVDNVPRIFVFFSPSTVEFVTDLLRKRSSNVGDIKAVAIGPVTKQALIQSGFEIYATASKPEPAALLKAINDAEENEEIGKTG